jgi:hypothetical protein
MFRLILFFIVMPGIGFAGGYGTREWISRRRRAIAREEYFERHPDRRHMTGQIRSSPIEQAMADFKKRWLV